MSIYVRDAAGSRKKIGGVGLPGPAATINGVNTLTVTGGRNIDLEQSGTDLTVHALVPGQNLLRNADFRQPVNRNGRGEYVGSWSWAIDGWTVVDQSKLAVKDGYLHFSFSKLNPWFLAQTAGVGVADGDTYTFSVFYKSDCKVRLVLDFLQGGQSIGTLRYSDLQPSSTWTMGAITFSTAEVGSYEKIHAIMQAMDMADVSETVDLIAAKLELGSQQTLARQNAEGAWELIDPPNYDLQYALCSQYSATTGEWVGSQHSNPNLLDNPNFAIWQRYPNGEFTGVPNGTYIADRFTITSSNGSIQSKIARVDGGGIKNLSGPPSVIFQRIENAAQYNGMVLTRSFLYEFDVKVRLESRTSIAEDWTDTTDVLGTAERQAWIMEGETLLAAKLELGPVQTLAHQDASGNWVLNDPPPNKALELLKCQRYFCKFSGTAAGVRYQDQPAVVCYVPTPAAMRIDPAIIQDANTTSLVYMDNDMDTVTSATVLQRGPAGIQLRIPTTKAAGNHIANVHLEISLSADL